MSSANPIVVNCGATHVSVSVFSASGGQLKLEKFLVQSLPYNYANEEEWLDVLTPSLRGIVRKLNLSGPATVIVPGYRLLTKNIKVPQVEKSRQRQIIAFEAQNSLPDAHEMVWDSQIISTDGVEAEVALFAHRAVDANRFTEAVRSAGLKPEVVDAATLLDYQAYHLAQREIEEEVLLVNIGARSTNLTFVSAAGFSIQNISIGGNLLTQSLADNLGKPFRAAEELKLQFFTGQIQSNPGDPLADTLQSNAQTFARRLGQDIARRIVNYKRQNQGRAPTRLLLTGRGSLLPGLSEQLCETLKISVDYFDPTETLQIGSQVQPEFLEAFRFQMSEAVGGAARLVLPDPVGVNLLPGRIAEQMAFAKKKPALVMAALLLAIAPLPVLYYFWTANKQVIAARQEVKKEYTRFAANQQEIQKVHEAVELLSGRVAGLAYVANAREQWGNFLAELQDALIQKNKHVWIEAVSVQRSASPAPQATDGKTPPLAPPSVRVTITVRALMDNIAPGAAFNADAVNAKFQEVRSALQKCSFVQKVDQQAAGSDQPNLPKRTFVLTINPKHTL